MQKIVYLLIVLFSSVLVQAQYKVTFIVKENTAIIHDSIYVAGTFNNWDEAANPLYLMKPHGKKEKSITLNTKAGTIKYKFHRGNWRTVEKQLNGAEVTDRSITIRKDTVLIDSVSSWLDQFFVDKWQTLSQPIPDTIRLKMLTSLTSAYAFETHYYNSDSALHYAQQALQLVQKMKASSDYKKLAEAGNSAELISLQETTAYLLHSLGNYPRALEMRLENLKLVENYKDKFQLVNALGRITGEYLSMKDYQSMLNYAKQQDSVVATLDASDIRYRGSLFWSKTNVATANYRLNNHSLALTYVKEALSIDSIDVGGLAYGRQLLADIYAAMNESDSALSNYRYIISVATTWPGLWIPLAQAGMAKVFQKNNQVDSALLYGRQALNNFQNNTLNLRSWGENSLYYVAEISPLLAELYKANNQPDSAYKYLQLSVAAKDSLYNTDKVRQFQTLGFNEANRRLQLEQQSKEEKQQYETKIKMYGLISIISGFVVLAFVQYRNNRQKQKANIVLQSQKQEIENTLSELKTTQTQLIQSEKMASLGELTAGIAHEIQNPLNFVNNFSEVNKELLVEMKDEIDKGNIGDAKAIADDVIGNEEKINHHGKRADAIVKGMLQHSRSSNGQKEPANINTLCDEYLRLAYHGLRAKDKTFNATLKTDFDESIGHINIIPQDIGRVILNLITNAFYVVDEKKKAPQPPEGGVPYDPTVSVSTKKVGDKVLISVKDNGNGIPKNIVDKIFQPFFTTKPTGQGTGLGLSLSYDIVKAHGGELKVETRENEGTTFIIQLPG
ncbi:MAG TPA: ATP-binding protein [Ferruginibacter sp.]|nr:ATP-binding protein [Ferruginibacter sp.]